MEQRQEQMPPATLAFDSASHPWYSRPYFELGGPVRTKSRFVIAGLLIVVAVVVLIVTSTGTSAHFFITIDELRAMGDEAQERNLTVSGAILGDTIAYDASVPRVTFTIVQVPADPKEVNQAGGLASVLHAAVNDPAASTLDVVYDDVQPALLQHEAQAIVRGRIGEDGRFYADEVLLKCPSRYEENVPDQAEGP
jgi:cytochrome c-type biogenesis protein CcmE